MLKKYSVKALMTQDLILYLLDHQEIKEIPGGEARTVEWWSSRKLLFTYYLEFLFFFKKFIYLSIMSTKAFIGYISIRCENFYILATR